MKNIDKIQIAEEMMTAALVECIEHRRYFAAINLAYVAEELYGKLIRISGEKTMRDEVIDPVLKEDKEGYLDRKLIKSVASYYKNSIKHKFHRIRAWLMLCLPAYPQLEAFTWHFSPFLFISSLELQDISAWERLVSEKLHLLSYKELKAQNSFTAVVSIMTSKIVATYSDPNYGNPSALNATEMTGDETTVIYPYSPFQVATAVSMVCGIYQLIMCVLRLGILSSLLSEALVNGFTTAAAVHVLTSQIKDVLGLSLPRHKGAFKILLSFRDIIMNLSNVNMNAVYISIVCIAILVFSNEFLKPRASKVCKFPIPTELLVVVSFTAISYIFNLGGPKFNVKQVGDIPTGLPMPQLPPIELVKLVAVDAIAVCIVSYSIVMSMALIFAKKEYYEVRPNQELLALGLSNILGSGKILMRFY